MLINHRQNPLELNNNFIISNIIVHTLYFYLLNNLHFIHFTVMMFYIHCIVAVFYYVNCYH
jgi:hypothetical protein